MAAPKGHPRYGGRTKGSGKLFKHTREIAERAAVQGITPLEYMLEVLRDKTTPPARRDDMAKAAAPYIHARLASIDAKVDVAATVAVGITQEARRAIAQEMLDRAFGLIGVSQSDHQIVEAEALPAPSVEGE